MLVMRWYAAFASMSIIIADPAGISVETRVTAVPTVSVGSVEAIG